MNADQLKLAEELASRPYQIELQAYETPDGEPYFFARVPELPGCVSDGDTEAEAKTNVKSAMVDFIYFLREDGLPVPEPKTFENFTIVNLSEVEDGSALRLVSEYRRLSKGNSYTDSGTTAHLFERRVNVA